MTSGPAAAVKRRWPVIAALGVQQIIAWGSTYYLLAVLAPAITADTGWPLPWVVGALSIALVAGGLGAPLGGRLIAHFGGRIVMACGIVTVAGGLLLMAMAQTLWFYLAAWCVLGLGMAMSLYDPAFSTLGQLYGHDARRSITALTLWGGFSITICWPLSAVLLEAFGWRGTAVAYAALNLCICLPLLLAVVPGAAPRTAERRPGLAQRLLLAGRERSLFLIMAMMHPLTGFVVTALSVHLLTMLMGKGLTAAEAVSLSALIGPAQFLARVLEMAGGGRFHPVWNMITAIALNTMGLLLLATGSAAPGLALLMFGAGTGVMSIARGALPLALFGPERYPLVMGRLARPSGLAQATAPLAGGFAIATLGIAATLWIVALASLASLALACLLAVLRPRASA